MVRSNDALVPCVNCGQHKRASEETCPHCGYETGIQDDESDSSEPQTIYGPVPWQDAPAPAEIYGPPLWPAKHDNADDTPPRPIPAPVYGPPPSALRRTPSRDPEFSGESDLEQPVLRTNYSKAVPIIGAIVGVLLLLWLLF